MRPRRAAVAEANAAELRERAGEDFRDVALRDAEAFAGLL